MKRLILFELILLFLATTFMSDNPPGWYQQTIPVNDLVNDIFFIDSLNGWLITDGNNFGSDTAYIIRTANGGNNWNIQYRQPLKLKSIQFLDLNTGYIAGGSGTGTGRFYKTTNGGTNWNLIFSAGIQFEDVYFVNANTGWICDADDFVGAGLLKTTDGGQSWTQQLNNSFRPSKLFFLNKDTGWAACNLTQLYRTTNGGTNWGPQFTSAFAIEAIFFLTPLKGWMRGGPDLNGNGVSYTTNGGFNWINGQGEICGFDIKFVNDSIGYTGKQSFRVAKSTDGGKTWGYQNVPIGNSMSVSILRNDTLNGWGGGTGVIHTTDGGGQLFMGVNQISNEIPSAYKLYQNYPNPFNPITKIKYQISNNINRTKSAVRIIIYDVTGKEVGRVVDEEQTAGIYEADFKAEHLSSGVYFYSLIVDGKFIDTKKMLLVK